MDEGICPGPKQTGHHGERVNTMAKYYCNNLSIKRDGPTITFNWSLPSDQKLQKKGTLQYKLVTDGKAASKVKWVSVKLTGAESCPVTATITLNPALYYPATVVKLDSVEWRVKTNGGTYQDGPSFPFSTPDAPELEVDGDMFIWSSGQDSVTNDIYFQDVEYQTTNSASETEPDWTAASVDTGTGTSSGYQQYTSDVDGYRWFRARVRGVHGASEWSMGSKSHSAPGRASDVSGSLSGNILSVSFKASSKVEQANVYYTVATPDTDFSCPDDAVWTLLTSSSQVSISDTNTVSGIVSGPPGTDKALWIRVDLVNTTTATGSVVRVAAGELSAPAITGFTVDTANKQITINYTNNSTVTGIFVAAVRSDKTPLKTMAASASAGTITFDYDNYNSANFGIFVFYGSVTAPIAQSAVIWQQEDPTLPVKPSNVSVEKTSESGKVQVSWQTAWSLAEATEITWSDDKDAWESNNEPESYIVYGTDAASWLISGLATGKKWYFRLRSVSETDGVAGPWSDLFERDLSEIPDAPAVWAEEAVITEGGTVTLGWAYVTRDGTEQKAAYVYLDGSADIAHSVEGGSQSLSFSTDWSTGTTHTIRMKTLSESGSMSDFSDSVSVTVAEALNIEVSTSLSGGNLLSMPLTVSLGGAGAGGTSSITIRRYGSFVAVRPDGGTNDGFDGETIYTGVFTGEVSGLSITPDDLTGRLDDKCRYVLICAISDSLGQTVTSETVFTVAWARQPSVPKAAVTVDTEDGIAVITVQEPDGYVSGDYCDIYRLSKDRPELIISKGAFDTQYVDPFPASCGGYRCVNVTSNGDYIGEIFNAWADIMHEMTENEVIIDFDGDQQVRLPYNVDLSSKWKKDFERTVYLNGAVQGDWNKGITRDVTVKTVVLKSDDDRIEIMRQLADYAGICHVRTPDGSSYAADIQVSESGSYGSCLVSYDLTVSKVQPQGYDGMTLADWQDEQEEE